MTLLYADTSALVRAYFADEPDHDPLRELLLEGDALVVTSELARLEFTSATTAAARAGRHHEPDVVLARFDGDCGDDGPLALVRLDAGRVLPEAHRLLQAYPLRTLDAIHVAVAVVELPGIAAGDDIGFVTRDRVQGAAATAEGLLAVG
jgi:predicted nucleic acid-binding protein